MRRVLLVGAAWFAAGVVAVAADKPRMFTGSLQVPPDQRQEVLKLLKEKGLTGAYVPETAAPETVMYRGPKADYEAAHDAVQRHLHPEWFSPRPQPRPTRDRGTTLTDAPPRDGR